MLPSTGYFKTINCPFYENGSCERPYCHFKHSRREDAANTAGMAGVVEAQATVRTDDTKATTSAASNSERLKRLVTEAVKKVLADQEVTDTEKFSKTIVTRVVEGLKPTLDSGPSAPLENPPANTIGKHPSVPASIVKPVPCVYNPTPIAELKKRHIPVVSYNPTRESRVAVKRKSSPDRIKPWLGINQDANCSQSAEVTYKPTAIVNTSDRDAGQSYVPTFKSDSSSSNSYEDSNSNDYVPKIKDSYYPKSKKRREEYVPKKIKAPLKNVQHIDETVLDQFEPEFDMIDEILTSAHNSAGAAPSEESQDYCLDVEPKFSDDEPTENTPDASANMLTNTKGIYDDIFGEAGEQNARSTANSKDKGIIENDQKNNIQDEDTFVSKKDVNKSTESTSKSREKNNVSKSKPKDRVREDDRANKQEHKSSKNHDKDKRDRSATSNKESHGYKSSDRKHSSPRDKDKDKGKKKSGHASKDATRKSKEDSHSQKHKDSTAEKDRKDRHKSSKREKHKSNGSSSKSTSEKHSSKKKHHSRNHSSRSSRRSSSRSRSSSKRKDGSSERNSSDREERSYSPLESVGAFLDDDVLVVSDSDHDVQEECLKIFQEYKVTDRPEVVSVKESPKKDADDNEEVGRKRVAHPSAAGSVARQVAPSQPPKKLPNPQQRMYERWRLMREAAAGKAAEKAATVAKAPVTTSTSTSAVRPISSVRDETVDAVLAAGNSDLQVNGNGRTRIARVPYATSLAVEKRKVALTETAAKAADGKTRESKTAAQTTKGGARVAHIPQSVPQLVRPEPLQAATQKFPLNVRQYYINIMHDICMQIYTNGDDAAQRAVKEEHACHERCKALPVYKNSCMLAAHRLRKEVEQPRPSSDGPPTATASGMVSHEAVLAGKTRGSWSVMKTRKSTVDLKGAALYSMLRKWILSEEQLRDNGFPRPHPDGPKGRAKMYATNTRNQTVLSKVEGERTCTRCGSAYMVNREGLAVKQQSCIYHWGRKFTRRGESRYSCCQQDRLATGCCVAQSHVWDYTDYENLRGYVKTLPKDVPVEEQGVYALDCEMCYTTEGLELTRVTVINEDCNVIYETLVKPRNTIIDYNTRFSGITEKNMERVTTSLLDVQATLLTMFSDKTILVGHSLESDFKALRLLHDTVVDTSVMFPHRYGFPQKRALKNLCSEYLNKLIQDDVGGHDSKEDAVACMELIRWKVKEEAKLH